LAENEIEETQDFKEEYKNILRKFEPFKSLQAQTCNAIEAVGIQSTLWRLLDYFATFIFLGFAILAATGPIFLAFYHKTLFFIIVFCPFIFLGWFVCLTRINYKTFDIIPFKKQIFPKSLLR
jgi:hypothetical protein